jgi:hypothetical protein
MDFHSREIHIVKEGTNKLSRCTGVVDDENFKHNLKIEDENGYMLMVMNLH